MKPHLATPMYLIVRRHRLGWCTAERDFDGMNRVDTIRDIVAEPAEVAMVIEFEADAHGEGGRWRDATSDLAATIADWAGSQGDPISPALRDFIETFAGIDHARGLRVLDPTFAAA